MEMRLANDNSITTHPISPTQVYVRFPNVQLHTNNITYNYKCPINFTAVRKARLNLTFLLRGRQKKIGVMIFIFLFKSH